MPCPARTSFHPIVDPSSAVVVVPCVADPSSSPSVPHSPAAVVSEFSRVDSVHILAQVAPPDSAPGAESQAPRAAQASSAQDVFPDVPVHHDTGGHRQGLHHTTDQKQELQLQAERQVDEQEEEEPATIRILSWNLHGKGKWSELNTDLGHWDILLLQEITPDHQIPHPTYQATTPTGHISAVVVR